MNAQHLLDIINNKETRHSSRGALQTAITLDDAQFNSGI